MTACREVLAGLFLTTLLLTGCGPESIVGQTIDLFDAAQQSQDAVELYNAGQYEAAIAQQEEVLATLERLVGAEHETAIAAANNLALFYREQGRLGEAETTIRQAVAAGEDALGPDDPVLITALNNLGGILVDLGNYEEAERAFERALSICEAAEGAASTCAAINLNDLSILYGRQGRRQEAMAYQRRAIDVARQVYGDDHRDTGIGLNNLAVQYLELGQYELAETTFFEALAVLETALGPDHPDTSTPINGLADLYQRQERFEEAQIYFERAITIREQTLGENHPATANSLTNLAVMLERQGRGQEAAEVNRRVLAIREDTLGADHPATIDTLRSLAILEFTGGQILSARSHMSLAVERGRRRVAGGLIGRDGAGEREQLAFHASALVELVVFSNDTLLVTDTDEAGIAFEAMQIATRNDVGATAEKSLAAFADGSGELATLLRQRAQTEERLAAIEADIVRLAGTLNQDGGLEALSAARAEANRERLLLETQTGTINDSFPAFADLVAGVPMDLETTQRALAADEALLMLGVLDATATPDRAPPIYSILVRADRASLRFHDLDGAQLDDMVAGLRRQLDPGSGGGVGAAFDGGAAFRLYDDLLGGYENMLVGVDHLYFVPDGAMESLPLAVLLTEPPPAEGDWREYGWLARDMAVTTLSSVASITVLQSFATPARGDQPFLGVGDPVLGGASGGKRRGIDSASLFQADGLANVRALRDELLPLPETADELRTVAARLRSDETALLLGPAATETSLRRQDIARHRVLSFATHGLLAGQIPEVGEPALVLTPPQRASPEDDGLLTASEIAALSIDADLVMLSACNTAASDGTPGAPGLSGLAKAFIVAGSRALMVSHWEVYSQAAQALTTGLIDAQLAEPQIGHAEALRRSMLALIDNAPSAEFAHPSVWGPFVIVGDGRAALRVD